MMIRYKVNDIAKDLGVTGKEIVNVLQEYAAPDAKKKSAQSALTEEELNIVLEQFTKKFEVKSIEAYLASAANTGPEIEPAASMTDNIIAVNCFLFIFVSLIVPAISLCENT